MAFPSSPSNNQQATVGGILYQYSTSTNSWKRIPDQVVSDDTIIDGGNLDGPSAGSGVTTITDVHNINDLADVDTATAVPTNGQALVWNGTTGLWIPGTVSTSSATETLSNKTIAGATITGHLIPGTNITYDLGSASYRFRDLYLSGSTIDLGGATMTTDASTGTIALVGKPTETNPNPTALVITSEGKTTSVATTAGEVNFTTVATQIQSNPGFSGSYSDLTNKPDFTAFNANIIPDTNNTRDLGSASKTWRHVYIGPGSLYVNGKQVITDDSDTITVSTSINQDLRFETTGTGDIEIDAAGTGAIKIQSTLQVEAGSNITSSDGNAIGFGNNIAVDGITSRSTNTNLTLSANGTGVVTVSDDLVVTGNLTISGTTTTVNTETISLADNIIDLNSNFTTGSPTENAGIRVMRGDSNNVTLRWNETDDVWEYTTDGTAYVPFVGTTATQTLTNKTISGSSNTLSNIANASLTNSSVTITAGTGMSGGGSVSLGSSITLTNAGVTSAVAGTGISVSGATGAVTITNSGVTSVTAGTGISVSASTGGVTITNTGPTMGKAIAMAMIFGG